MSGREAGWYERSAPCWSSADSPSLTATNSWRSAVRLTAGRLVLEAPRQDAVGEAVLDRLVRLEEAVAVDVVHHLLDAAAGMLRDDLGVAARQREDLFCRDLDVGRRAAEAARALGDHPLRVGQAVPLAVRAGREDERSRRHRHADAV